MKSSIFNISKITHIILLLVSICFISCKSTQKLSTNDLSYSDIIQVINTGLNESKDIIDSSQYILSSGTIKLYTSNEIGAQAGLDFWIIEGGYNWSKEKASSISYKFTEIKPIPIRDAEALATKNLINPVDFSNLIQKAINNFDSVDAITKLDKEGFDVNLKFSIKRTANAKLDLDFGIGASAGGSKGRSVAHEITLSFKRKK